MGGPRDHHTEEVKIVKGNINDIICKVESKEMNKHNKAKTGSQIQRRNRCLPEGRGLGGGEKQVSAIKRYKTEEMSHGMRYTVSGVYSIIM